MILYTDATSSYLQHVAISDIFYIEWSELLRVDAMNLRQVRLIV
jgi:hypothetical protein